MSFGDDDQMPAPPPLPPPPPAAPQFASGLGRPQNRGKPFGGTLLSNPLATAASGAATINRTLVTS